MRLGLSDEQRRFAQVLHEMLSDGGNGRRLWAALGAAGVTGLMIPERYDGVGAGADDLVIACEQLGRHAVAGPVAESIAAAPLLLTGDEERLAGLAAGRIVASVVAPPWLPYALDGDSADLVLLVDGDAVHLGLAGAVHQSMDPVRRLVDIERGALLGTGRPVRRALDLGVLACSAQLLGAGQALLEMSIEHARTRNQFGRPIGAFQAVRHQLADVSVALDFARPLLYAAAVALDQPVKGSADAERDQPAWAAADIERGRPARGAAGTEPDRPAGVPAADLDAGRDVSAAKVACGQAALLAARTALQVHGAIGYTAEHRLGRYLTLVRALNLSWGTPDQHRRRVLAAITSEPDRTDGVGTAAAAGEVRGTGGVGTAGVVGATAGEGTPPPVSHLGAVGGVDVPWPPRSGAESAGADFARTEREGS
jgi:alkylation response protein AidB-like acyl-CoA dehydrogenase